MPCHGTRTCAATALSLRELKARASESMSDGGGLYSPRAATIKQSKHARRSLMQPLCRVAAIDGVDGLRDLG